MGCCASASKPQVLPEPSAVGVEEALKLFYKAKILPSEKRHDYEHFFSPPLDDAEFYAKPSVLLLGQYSVGKTSMIRYLLGKDYPGSRIGPEPTTDQFVCVLYGEDTRILPGPALVSDGSFPFKSLDKFGQAFLQRLSGAMFKGPLLQHLIFIDTPGILSGEKQRISRGYDFDAIIKFLAEKVDRILLLFDISKLDISDEFKVVLQTVQGNAEKIKILLNKADSIEAMELNQVRGALMWNLGKILNTPEVPKVFVGSFWDQPLRRDDMATKQLFANDYRGLLDDLRELPRSVKVRKINDLVKRAKNVRYHALIMDEMMKRDTCNCCSDNAARIKAIATPAILAAIYKEIMLKYRVHEKDLPSQDEFRQKCLTSDYRRWNPIDKADFAQLESFIDKDIILMIKALPSDKDTTLPEIQAMESTVDQLQTQLPDNLKGAAPPPPKKEKKEVEIKLSAMPELGSMADLPSTSGGEDSSQKSTTAPK